MIQFHTVTLNSVPLHYGQAPGPGPALVIVHGLTGSHTEFLHLAPELARQAHVYLPDWRGHGRSGHSQTDYQIADYGSDLIAFCRQTVNNLP
ncbi:MAG: alpha/beta fold hydrolase [Chloroflexota bacterium]